MSVFTEADCLIALQWQVGPEFAFIGRSNAGKSSLVNLLTNIPNLAKVSSKPGEQATTAGAGIRTPSMA